MGQVREEKTKGKRPTVQINEKQIMGGGRSDVAKPNEEAESSKRWEKIKRNPTEQGPNRAAEALEHTVVMASEHGACVTKKIVSNDGTVLMEEHHNDPPSHDKDGMDEDFFADQCVMMDELTDGA